MRTPWILALLSAFLLLDPGCSDGDDDDTTDAGDDDTTEEIAPPGVLLAGIAEMDMPVPLGIGTMGYGQLGADPSITPFSDKYPGTTRQHAALTLKAVAISRGEHYEVIFVRTDTIGVFQHLRQAVLDELELRLGRDLNDSLVIGGNHTHAGPGRMLDTDGVLTLLGDTFLPEFYDNTVLAIADVVEAALADLEPAEIGHAMASTSDAHNDRRCANDALLHLLQENPSLPVIAVQRGGTTEALVMSYGYHGTVLDWEDLTLCPDMGGIVEQKVAERFDHPVSVLFFNSWGGDMSPGPGSVDPADPGADQPGGYDKMEKLGQVVADAIEPHLGAIVFDTEPEVRALTRRVTINRETMGYADDEFPYPNGGVYCGQGYEENCVDDTPLNEMGIELDQGCVPFPEDEPAPDRTLFTAGQLGDLYFITATGEWSTSLADHLLADMWELSGSDQTMFVGYAQDYTGYSITEDDWWQGGYESGGGMWGPRQGDYLAARGAEIFHHFVDPSYALPFEEPAPMEPFSGYSYEPYQAEVGLGAGDVHLDVPPVVGASDVVTFTVLGHDPWLGLPVATLERDSGSGFAEVTRANGTPVTSEGYEFWVDLSTDPEYADVMPAPVRTFYWTFHYPVTHRVPTTATDLTGSFRFRVAIPTDAAGATTEAVTAVYAVGGASALSGEIEPSRPIPMWR